jgi:hypothetical protein
MYDSSLSRNGVNAAVITESIPKMVDDVSRLPALTRVAASDSNVEAYRGAGKYCDRPEAVSDAARDMTELVVE